jgi:alpha-beta hydrolase superfamily lysophospholipase
MLDALAVADWAMNVASIPSSRILIFAQSMGTAVSIAVSKNLALQSPPVVFAGTILVAPFVDVATLVATYRVAGTIPILSPLAKLPLLFNYLQRKTQTATSRIGFTSSSIPLVMLGSNFMTTKVYQGWISSAPSLLSARVSKRSTS